MDEFLQASQKRRPRCSFHHIIPKLEPDQADKLASAFADDRVTGVGIAKVLTAWGHEVSTETANRHRRGGCSCG